MSPATRVPRARAMSLAVGTRLGVYEILSPVGAGGMGEVYRARDGRLGRDVAVKVLPGNVSSRERRKRFEREARAAGALNHPNVLTVYDVGAHEGALYLVTELLEGETLRARLHGSGLAPRGLWRSRGSWPPGSRRCTRRGSCTVTSSPRTCSSPGMAGPRSSTSVWRT